MNETHTSLEVIAPSTEEALKQGLHELGVTQEEVEIEILDEGTKGLFGLGSRQARIRLTLKAEATPPAPRRGEAPKKDEPQPANPADPDLETARATVAELLEKMGIRARVSAAYLAEDEYRGQKPILVDVRGDDLSLLIGRKNETLNALQYIAGLILGKELGRAVPLSIDVEGYRARRNRQLQQLAQRVAKQVAQTGRSQSLEPMPAGERRIIHIELRDNPTVYTESIGEGERRKVVIHPK